MKQQNDHNQARSFYLVDNRMTSICSYYVDNGINSSLSLLNPISQSLSKSCGKTNTTVADDRTHPKPKKTYYFIPIASAMKKQFSAIVYPKYRKPNYNYNKKWKSPDIRNVPISYSPLPANHTVVVITAGGKVGIDGMLNGRKCLPLSKTR